MKNESQAKKAHSELLSTAESYSAKRHRDNVVNNPGKVVSSIGATQKADARCRTPAGPAAVT